MNYREYLQKVIYVCVDPLIRGMLKMGLTPNAITFAGFVGNLIAAWYFITAGEKLASPEPNAYAYIVVAGALILFAGLFDMLDGRMARLGNLSSTFGALWDSTLDRYSELVTLFGVAAMFGNAGNDWQWMSVITGIALIGSIMVSYVRARAEALDIECKVGIMQRPERVVVLAVGALASGLTANLLWLALGIGVIALLANITAFWRIGHCYKELKKKDAAK